MKTFARWVLVVVVLVGAAGCGGSDPSPAAAARTTACRHYLLGGGVDDEPIAAELVADSSGDSTFDANRVNARLVAVGAAAARAGATAHLSTTDFGLYRDVVANVAALEAQVLPSSDNVSLDGAAIAKYRAAVSALHDRCD